MKYAVIEETHTTIPGDERSRTHPGHGYPEHTQTSTKFQEFPNEDALLRHIKTRSSSYSGFKGRVIRFEEMKVNTEVNISLSE
jgi:hypothetical protein